MKSIIDGRRYDTTKSKLVFEWNNGCYKGDFYRRERDLYQTKNGSWFVHNIGGALTDMSVSVGNNMSGGSEDIEPLTENQAYNFLERYNATDVIEKYFVDQIQDA